MTPDDLMQLIGLLADLRRQVLTVTDENAELRRRLELASGDAKQNGLAHAAQGLADAFEVN